MSSYGYPQHYFYDRTHEGWAVYWVHNWKYTRLPIDLWKYKTTKLEIPFEFALKSRFPVAVAHSREVARDICKFFQMENRRQLNLRQEAHSIEFLSMLESGESLTEVDVEVA